MKRSENELPGSKQSLIKQMLWIVGVGIALLVFVLLASGIFFTGAVVQNLR